MSTSFKATNGGDGILETDTLIVDGTTISSTEIAFLDGVTAGTVTASKAVVVDANKHIDTIVIADGGLKLGATTGTAVTSTADELNLVDGSIAGTAVASKAAVLGANKNLDTLVIADSGLFLGAGAGTAVTRTAAQINLLTQGVAAGYKVARGTVTSTSASHTVDTGLVTFFAVAITFNVLQTLTHMFNYGDVGDQAGTP